MLHLNHIWSRLDPLTVPVLQKWAEEEQPQPGRGRQLLVTENSQMLLLDSFGEPMLSGSF